jgi:hypothetical protein
MFIAHQRLNGGILENYFELRFTSPADPRWGGAVAFYRDPNGYDHQLTGTIGGTVEAPTQFSQEVFFNAPNAVEVGTVYIVSADYLGRMNTIVPGQTPSFEIQIGTASGNLDFTKALAGSFDSAEFHVDPDTLKWSMKGVDFSKALAGTFSTEFQLQADVFSMKAISAEIMNTGILEVGGQPTSGSRVSRFKVFDNESTPNLIGWVGDDSSASGYVGAWFKRIMIGGTSPANAKIVADASGNVALSGSLLTGPITIGGGQNVSYLTAYNGAATPAVIAWMGNYGGVYGAWFKNFWAGGTGPTDAPIRINADGTMYIGATYATTAGSAATATTATSASSSSYATSAGTASTASSASSVPATGVSSGQLGSGVTLYASSIQAGTMTVSGESAGVWIEYSPTSSFAWLLPTRMGIQSIGSTLDNSSTCSVELGASTPLTPGLHATGVRSAHLAAYSGGQLKVLIDTYKPGLFVYDSTNGVVQVIGSRQSAIASPTADVASLKTAVDAIRTALINHGLTW